MTSPAATAELAQAAVDALDATARAAKRQEAASRRTARESRQAIDRIRRACEELGIELHLNESTAQGGHSDRRDTRT